MPSGHMKESLRAFYMERVSAVLAVALLFVFAMPVVFGMPADGAGAGRDSDVRIPEQIFTPEILELMGQGAPYNFVRMSRGFADRYNMNAGRYAQISESRWRELISPHTPVSVAGIASRRPGKCPFCGKTFRGLSMELDGLFTRPFSAVTGCCGNIVYEREEDMPEDYPARPNHTELIPHLDGTEFDYRFYVAEGREDDRNNWFSSAGEVWRARQDLLVGTVMPELASAALFGGDSQAVLQLAVVLDRLADVVPGYPLYDRQTPHGFAPRRDGEWYLTREEYMSIRRPKKQERPFWYHSRRGVQPGWDPHALDKMPGASSVYGGWDCGIMAHAGFLAACFEVVRDRPEVMAWSRSKHGDAEAFESRVMENVIGEYEILCKSFPASRRNTFANWVRGAFAFGIFTQDLYFLERVCGVMENMIVNNFFSDGLAAEGSFNYSRMIVRTLGLLWMVEYLRGIELSEEYPILDRIRKLGSYPIMTLYNIESMHGNQSARFFASMLERRGYAPPEPGEEDYEAHEKSQCFPESGFVALRAGEPGSRLEKIMDFQVTGSHTHAGKLNLQLFYEGINLLPDFGLFRRQVFTDDPEFQDYDYHFEKLPMEPAGRFQHDYVWQPQSHCTGLVDGINHRRLPGTFHRFLGGQKLGEPGYTVQFAEADARAALRPDIEGDIERFHRQLAAVTLPNGRSVALDFFRMKGGSRHEMYWHVPAEDAEISLPAPEQLPHRTLQGYIRSLFGEDSRRDSALEYLNNPGRREMPEGTWSAQWHIRPSEFEPYTSRGRERYEGWKRILHDVHLRMWGFADGDRAVRAEILSARGPWPSGMWEEKPRTADDFAFVDALEFLVLLRAAREAPLESTFVHVLEPWNPGQEPVLESVEPMRPGNRGADAGAGVRMGVRNAVAGKDVSEVFVGTTANAGEFYSGDFILSGRMGMTCPDSLDIVLYDGTELWAGDFGVKLEPGWSLELKEVVGDLTGTPGESALIVESSRPLPLDGTLSGMMLTVEHQISDIHASGYTIEGVRSLGGSRYWIDLRGRPPFIQFQSEVQKIERNLLYGMDGNRKGSGYGTYRIWHGRKVLFPRTGFSACINMIRDVRLFLQNCARLTPVEGAVETGDEFVIHTIQPGDNVVIPSLFSARGESASDASAEIKLHTTGSAALTLPGMYRAALLESGVETFDLKPRNYNGRTVVEIDREDLKDGRAMLKLYSNSK